MKPISSFINQIFRCFGRASLLEARLEVCLTPNKIIIIIITRTNLFIIVIDLMDCIQTGAASTEAHDCGYAFGCPSTNISSRQLLVKFIP